MGKQELYDWDIFLAELIHFFPGRLGGDVMCIGVCVAPQLNQIEMKGKDRHER